MNSPSAAIASARSIIWYVAFTLLQSRADVIPTKPGAYVAHDGSAVVVKNVICIHEEDAGLLWKHTDFRVGGRAQAVRSRRLVIQQICTLANYGEGCRYLPSR